MSDMKDHIPEDKRPFYWENGHWIKNIWDPEIRGFRKAENEIERITERYQGGENFEEEYPMLSNCLKLQQENKKTDGWMYKNE